MHINYVGQALGQVSVFPTEPLEKRHEPDVDLHFSPSPIVLTGEEHRNYSGDRKSNVDRRFSPETGAKREFPPPIPLLARTENLQPRMPWILRRQYTGDGRLVLTEEKSHRHEYFQANRCNGRLTLDLVSLDVSERASDRVPISVTAL